MPLAASASYLIYRVVRLWSVPKALQYLMAAHRYFPTARFADEVARRLPTIREHMERLLGKNAASIEHVARRSIVLKWPTRTMSGIERGVLLISFTTSFPYYHQNLDLELLQRWFTIVLEPSWAGYCVPEILFWADGGAPVVVQATEKTDFEFIASLETNIEPVEFGASNWVDHRVFRPLVQVEKKYDAVYVGNYRPIKRHHVLFRAIKQINDPGYRVALACTPWGGGTAKQTVYDLLDHYGVRGNVDVYEGLAPAALNELLNASKVCVLLSLKEGSNRSIFEGFFANVPGIVLVNNVGMNKSYVNQQTGQLVEEGQLAKSLLHFREHWASYQPHQWAMRTISPEVTTDALASKLRELAVDRGETWTRSLRVKVNRPEVEYMENAESFPLSTIELLELFSKGTSADRIEIELLGSASS